MADIWIDPQEVIGLEAYSFHYATPSVAIHLRGGVTVEARLLPSDLSSLDSNEARDMANKWVRDFLARHQ